MNTPVFYIKTIKNNKNGFSLKDVMTREHLDFISETISNEKQKYTIKYLKERNVGNYIIYKHKNVKNYVILLNYRSSYGHSEGRNSFVQSIPTAYLDYLKDPSPFKNIYFYDVNYKHKKYQAYISMFLKLAMTIGIQPLNGVQYESYATLEELITFRNNNKERNRQNNSSFIEKTDSGINIYGKVFGANSKETEMICHAVNHFYSGKINLFQITENKSEQLSKKFLDYLESTNKFNIKNDTYSFQDLISDSGNNENELNLRNPKFINNLFEKYGDKSCALCCCNIHQLIEGAHIFPIEAIKKLDVSDEEKLNLATDPRNGLWLCKNHHKLFDSHILIIQENSLGINPNLSVEHFNYIQDSFDQKCLEKFGPINNTFLDLRYQYYEIEL